MKVLGQLMDIYFGKLFAVCLSFVAAIIVYSTPLKAASFDCSKADTPTELAICNDQELGTLDVLLNEAYQLAQTSPHLDSQAEWLVARDLCTDDVCLRDRMGERIAQLLHLSASSDNVIDELIVETREFGPDDIFLRCRQNYQGGDEIVYSEILFSFEKNGPTFRETNILPESRYSESVWGWYNWTAAGNAGGLQFAPEGNFSILRRGYEVSESYVEALSAGVTYSWSKRQADANKVYFIVNYFEGDIVADCIQSVPR